uniref:Uncharacterized protein n=1 Tax=Anguilla anguilla TaxID=7936 RepID=A0A0E9PQ55_ANGAN
MWTFSLVRCVLLTARRSVSSHAASARR